jgi:hypothetical protein
MNRLGSSTSPYLRQHADNPVDWWEWSDEAFASARERDVPILLSVGYAACHWCHVMAHESFENADVAAVMNAGFVNIKVDREERPDIDAVYMDATTALTGQGGWPMTCLLTPDGAPFYAGTYFPRDHFVRLLTAVGQAWRGDRAEVLATGQRVVDALARSGAPRGTGVPLPGGAELDGAVGHLVAQFDRQHGGFGRAPKFPPAMTLEFLLRAHERSGDPTPLALAEHTFDAMARGGMYDQLAGGFARYSVDQAWVVPHFEKMLYDNALLLRGYLHWWRRTGAPLAERIARETADFLLRDLRTAEGGFASALDADTDGVEGLTYAWTPAQLAEVLGTEAPAAAALFEVTEEGTFEHGASTLQLLRDPADPAQWDDWRTRLYAARTIRPQPARDDKVVTAWNGLAIAGLAEAGVLFDEPAYLDAAVGCARLLLDRHLIDGRLRRTSRDGAVGAATGVLEDYGDLADGLLVLHQVTGDARWLAAAGDLLDTALEHFGDGAGGFFDTADDAEQLVRRPQDPTDNATPSGASALAVALLAYSALTGSSRHREAAEAAVQSIAEIATAQPRFFSWALAAAEGFLAGPVQVAVVGEPDGGPLTATAWRLRPPGAVVVSGAPDTQGVPLLADRPLVGGQAAAYVCRGMVCDLPVTTTADLGSAFPSR